MSAQTVSTACDPKPSPELFRPRLSLIPEQRQPLEPATVFTTKTGDLRPPRKPIDGTSVVRGMCNQTVEALCFAAIKNNQAPQEVLDQMSSANPATRRIGLACWTEMQTEAAYQRLLDSSKPLPKKPGLTPTQIAAKRSKKSAASRAEMVKGSNPTPPKFGNGNKKRKK